MPASQIFRPTRVCGGVKTMSLSILLAISVQLSLPSVASANSLAPEPAATSKISRSASEFSPARPASTSPEAAALADKLLGAMGGYKNFKQFNDLPCRARGKITQTSSISNVVNSFDCDIIVKREKQRITIKFLGQPMTTVYDGKSCWTEQGDSILPSDKETARRIEEDIQHGFLLLESVKNPRTIMQVGKPAMIEGKECDALLVWAEDGVPTTFYADKVKHTVAASTYPGVDLEQGLKIDKSYHYFDYRPIDKTIQPFKVVEYSGNKKVSETLIESVTVDEKISDAAFIMPKEVVSQRLLSGPVTIPFEYVGNEIIIHATVHGAQTGIDKVTEARELKFIVDTGATQSILDRTAARTIGTLSPSNLAMTTGAGSIQTEAITIDKLTLGDLVLNNIPFATADLSTFGGDAHNRPAGLIGANVLKRFLVTVDYENRQITFADPTRVEVPAGATAVNTTPSLGMAGLAVEGNINGKQKVTFLIDTGAAFNNIAESKVKALLPGPLYQIGMLKGLDGKKVKTAAARFDYLDLDGLHVDKPVFSVAPEAVGPLNTGIINSKDLAILGNPILSRYTVSFDYRGQRLIFSQSAQQKAAAEFNKKLSAVRLGWLKTNDATTAAHELTEIAEEAGKRNLPGIEAIVRAELALAYCQLDGGSFTPDALFAPIKPEELVAESNGTKSKASPASEKMFARAEAELLTAFTLAEKLKDKTVEGRVLALWGLMYASQDKDILFLASAKQKLGKAVALTPADADVLASSGYFLGRLEAVKVPSAPVRAEETKAPIAKAPSRVKIAPPVSARKNSVGPSKAAYTAGLARTQPPVAKVEGDRTVLTFKSPREAGAWLVDQIIDQAIMIDPSNWLALWSKYDRVKSQGKSDDMKMLVTQLKHYYPDVNIDKYLR